MPATNNRTNFGYVSKTFHWLTAILIITAFPFGMIANDLPFSNDAEIAQKAWLFSAHKTIGVLAFFTAFFRILWALSQPKPAHLNTNNQLETQLADLVHWLLYFSMLLVPLSGWLHHAASSVAAPIWLPFGANIPFVPKSESLSALFSGGHFIFTKLLFISVGLHVVGAIKHTFVDRDKTMARMLPGHTQIDARPEPNASRTPLILAITIYVGAMALGVTIGTSAHVKAPVTHLASVASEWQVEDGEIEITVTQFGNKITGNFDDWTAAINFDPDRTDGPKGQVDVTINMASLEFGSLTDQALGTDFFDLATHTTASFKGDIVNADAGFLVNGGLTLKGVTLPVTLPFTLDINQNTARMAGTVSLNRMDFGIGQGLPDEGSLKFAVTVHVNLTASRP